MIRQKIRLYRYITKYLLPQLFRCMYNRIRNCTHHPIGSVVHQKMEPNGHGTVSKKDDKLYINVQNTSKLGITTTDRINNNTVFAAEYGRDKINEIIKKLNPTYQKELSQYNKGDGNLVAARFSLNMPETNFMHRMRNLLNTVQRVNPIQLLKKAIGLEK